LRVAEGLVKTGEERGLIGVADREGGWLIERAAGS
jgi:hypothetical protein